LVGGVTTLYQRLHLDGKVIAAVRVAGLFFHFHASKMMAGRTYPLTYWQLRAWEPVLANFRAAAAAKVKAKIIYDSSSRRVDNIYFYFF